MALSGGHSKGCLVIVDNIFALQKIKSNVIFIQSYFIYSCLLILESNDKFCMRSSGFSYWECCSYALLSMLISAAVLQANAGLSGLHILKEAAIEQEEKCK